MKILFVSNDLIAGNLAWVLKKEGHEVKLYIEDIARRSNFQGLVEQTLDWKSELDWVGFDGLIIFDDVGYGEDQDSLRKKGYQVVGGSAGGDKIEQDRVFGQELFHQVGMQTVPIYDFENSKAALEFVKLHPQNWVIKQNNHHYSKTLNYIGQLADGRDVIDLLIQYNSNNKYSNEKITIQERIHGVEIGVGRYFNGTDWVGPIEYNLEHPHFFPGNIGPMTSEMGTLAWYDDNEQNKLYQETLALMRDTLRDINFRGDFEINCIVNRTGAYPLEATTRFGSPIVHLHTELHQSPWGEFLLALAQGNPYDLKWNKGLGIVTLLATPPFPYASSENNGGILKGSPIYFENFSSEDWKHIHLEEVSYESKDDRYAISDTRGYVLYVTALGKTVSEAQEKSKNLIEKIIFPKKMYRNDIGNSFELKDYAQLKKWGWLS